MIAPEREFLQAWQDLHYPPGPEMPEEPQSVQVAQAPIEGPGGAAFGVFPAMRSAARPGVKSEAAAMLPADVAAGAAKGMITGGVGMPGDIESLIRGVRGIFTRGGDQGKLDAFLTGMEEKTILPTSEDVSKWLDANVGPVVPPGAPMAKQRAGVAAAGQFAGEMVSGPGTLVKGAKAGAAGAAATVKFVKPKVGEMLSDYMSRSGLTPELMAFHGTPARFAAEEGAPLGRFRSEKIGSGEGSQAFGYGLYFAENPKTAKEYQFMARSPARRQGGLTQEGEQQKVIDSLIKLTAKQFTDGDVNKLSKLIDERPLLFRYPEEMKKRISEYKDNQPPGFLYTVDIPDDMIGKMLDYDKPLSEQPKSVRDAVENIKQTITGPFSRDMTGNQILMHIQSTLKSIGRGSERAEDILRQQGIPGIRYLDLGTRGQLEGTRNIVVFPGEEDKVKILKVE